MASTVSTPNNIPGFFNLGNPVQDRVQKAHEEGRLTNSQRAILDSVENPLSLTIRTMNMAGFTPADAKALAERNARYAKMADQFIGHPASLALTSDEQVAGVGNYDRQTLERQVRATVQGVASGQISAGEFRALNNFGRETEALRGQFKGDGYTEKERAVLEGRFSAYDNMLKKFLNEDRTPAPTQKADSDALFAEAKKQGPALGGSALFGGSKSDAENKILADRQKAYIPALLKSGGLIEPMDRQAIRESIQGPVRKIEDPQELPVSGQPLARLKSIFSSIDSGKKDGKLTRPELIAALSDPKWKGEDARVIAAATRAFDKISTDENSSAVGLMGGIVNPSQVQERKSLSLEQLNSDDGYIKEALSNSYNHYKELPKGPQSLFGKGSTPDLHSLKQGSEGDCWALASATSMKPEEVQRMLEQRPDGSYLVRFPGRKPEAVAALTEGERHFYSSAEGSWSGVLEKGIRQVMERDARAQGKNLDFQDLMNGGLMGRATEILTGKGSKDFVFSGVGVRELTSQQGMMAGLDRPAEYTFNPQKVGGLLTEAFAQGKPVTAATSLLHDSPNSRLAGQNHAYAVVGYDEKTQTVTIRNPWGKNETADVDGKDDGLFKMPLAEFQSSFSFMNIGGQPQKAGVR